jgi:starvation-inducible DNA-binding protein
MGKDLFEKLNKYLADTAVMYIKLHNLHWNVSGLQFKAVHEFLEGLYDGITENMDAIAEIMRIHGKYPAASMEEYLKLTSVKELPSKKIDVKTVLTIVLDELKALESGAKEVRAVADADDTFDVANMMEDHCAEFSKTLWFIESMLSE